MAIPQLDNHGLLPVGAHPCTLQEIQADFCWNAHRQNLFERLELFLDQRWKPLNVNGDLWINGSFTRRKDNPKDIDVVADVSHLTPQEFMPVLLVHLTNDVNQHNYNVDFWVKHALFPHDLTQFFQYTGLKAAAELRLDVKRPKGILKVSL